MTDWYDHDDGLERWVKKMKRRVRNDFDAFILITGYEGMGKSSLAFLLALAFDRWFSVDNICMTGTEFMARATRVPKYGALVFDEAVHGALGRNAMSKANKLMAEFFTICRQRNLVMLACFPNHLFLDKLLRDHRAQWMIHVESRGRALIREAERSRDGDGTYWRDRFRFQFPRAEGALWNQYLQKKSDHVAGAGRPAPPPEDGAVDDMEDAGEQAKLLELSGRLEGHPGFQAWLQERTRDPQVYSSKRVKHFWRGP